MKNVSCLIGIFFSVMFASHASATTLFQEDWASGSINPAKWNIAAGGPSGVWPGQGVGGTVTLVDQGGGDFAAKLNAGASGSWYSPVGLYSVPTFSRGNTLRVTFRWWGGVASPHGLMAPWHKLYPGNNMTETVEAAATLGYNVMQWSETGFGTGPVMDLNTAMTPWPNSKANSILIRVTLGDTQGSKLEYSTNNGGTYTVDTKANTIGTGGSTTLTGLLLGFGQGNGIEFVDDIIVENGPSVPVELSQFSAE